MRVATVKTATGNRLAVRTESSWRVVNSETAPTSIDALIHGGTQARDQIEKEAANGEDIADTALQISVDLSVPKTGKIICVGLNYMQHAIEAGVPMTETPMLFNKFNSSLTAAGQEVVLPSTAHQYDYEVELGVVIGRPAEHVDANRALDHVWGYFTANDLSARDLQMRTSQFMLGKALDGFLPVGPQLVSADEIDDVQSLSLQTWVNGELRQKSDTSKMVFSVAEIISYISQYLVLEVGDIIVTGTPEGVIMGQPEPRKWLTSGDVVEVEVGGLGRLRTPLVADQKKFLSNNSTHRSDV